MAYKMAKLKHGRGHHNHKVTLQYKFVDANWN